MQQQLVTDLMNSIEINVAIWITLCTERVKHLGLFIKFCWSVYPFINDYITRIMLMSFISYVPTGCTPAQTSGSHDSDRPSSIAYARSAFHPGYLRYYFLLFALWTCRDYQSKSSKFEVLSLFSYVLPMNRKRRKGPPPSPPPQKNMGHSIKSDLIII